MEIIKLGKFEVGSGRKPFIIAEMSGNHNQSLDRALELVDAAAKTGAQALKLQTYTADTITLDVGTKDFFISDEKNLWQGNSLHKLYDQAHTPWEWHPQIFARARELGMECFSTPFDETAVDFLEKIGCPFYKIASFENNHIPLIRKVAKTGKPIIISTGLASIADLDEAVKTIRAENNSQIILLKCTSTYPATPENTNISTIPHMRDLFQCQVGLSDHTMGIGVSVAAVALGATVIEKHFTLSRADGGVDSAFSMEPQEMQSLVSESERAWLAKGEIFYGPTKAESKSLQFRRSIYVSEDISAGEAFSQSNIRVVRPGFGLAPKFFGDVVGRKAGKDLKKGTPLSWDLIS